MLDRLLLERAIDWSVEEWGPARLEMERRHAADASGAMVPGEADYEARIAHFLERYLCESEGAPGLPLALVLARGPRPRNQQEREQLLGWARSHRSLFEVIRSEDTRLHLQDLLLHGRYACLRLESERDLLPGERLDARIVPADGALVLSPARLFHTREAHPAIDALLRQTTPAERGTAWLDALLRMRASFMRFESIRAEHVYRPEAITDPTLAAPWAKRTS